MIFTCAFNADNLVIAFHLKEILIYELASKMISYCDFSFNSTYSSSISSSKVSLVNILTLL